VGGGGKAGGCHPGGRVYPFPPGILAKGGLGGFGGGFETEKLNNKRRLLMTEGVLPRVEGNPEREVDLTLLFDK